MTRIARMGWTAIVCAMTLLIGLVSVQIAWADDLAAGTGASAADAKISYRVHECGAGWSAWAADGKQAGAGVNSFKVDGLLLSATSSLSGGVQYQVYIKGTGWQSVKSNGAMAGKASKKVGVEAVRIALTGELSKQFDVAYSVRPQKGSWTGFVTNGAIAGKAGKNRLVTGLKVELRKKASASSATGAGVVGVRYRAKMQKGGWQVWKANNSASNKSRKNNSIKSLKISLDKGVYAGSSIKYRVRLTNGRWKAWKTSGKSIGSFKNVEALRIKLSGPIAAAYDVVYRTNVKGVGWQKRTMNGGVAGTRGTGLHVRAVKVKLVERSKRSGWYGKDTNWQWYSAGSAVKGKLITTTEAPINALDKKSRKYWLDANGKLAVNRLVNPENALDAAAGGLMFADENGVIVTSKTLWIDELGGWYAANKNGVLRESDSDDSNHIERYVQWALDIANDDSHGYSQAVRWGPDYDCSSLVIASLKAAGFQVGAAVYTGNMKSELTKYGFKWHTNFKNLQRGDILLVHNSNRQHTEIYIGNGMTVGAHIAETGGIRGKAGDQTGNEISTARYTSIWEGYLRYKS